MKNKKDIVYKKQKVNLLYEIADIRLEDLRTLIPASEFEMHELMSKLSNLIHDRFTYGKGLEFNYVEGEEMYLVGYDE